jgi:uncharacterized protein
MHDGAEYFPAVETHYIRANNIAQTFRIDVMQPRCIRGESASFPVVYVSDGNFVFDALKGICRSIQQSGYDAPRFMLVGIGYPGDGPFAGSILRIRDLTFPGYPRFITSTPHREGVLVAPEGTPDCDGAMQFQEFIEQEVFTLIEAKYPATKDDRTFFGHSAGGGFGLFTLFNRSSLFSHYLISSPGLTYDGVTSAGIRYDHCDFLLAEGRRFISSGPVLANIRLYLSVGAEEEFDASVRNWRLTSSVYRLAAMLRSADLPGLHLTFDLIPDETHMTVWPIAFIRGIRAVLGHK